jgi:hypothetical protein
LIGPAAAEEAEEVDDDPEWQETQRNADESARLRPEKRMTLYVKLSPIQIQIGQIQIGQDWGGRF